MEDNSTPIVWWQSRIIWAQLLAALFAIFGIIKMVSGYDIAAQFNLDSEALLTAIMLIVPAVTLFYRTLRPTPPVVSSHAEVARTVRAQNAMSRQPEPAPRSRRPRS
jgi:hypothetical protein